MPRGDQIDFRHQLIKLLLIGDGKIGKTAWALEAAAQGFNVLLLDGDVATQTLAQMPTRIPGFKQEHLARICRLDMHDRIVEGKIGAQFAKSFNDFIGSTNFMWNDDSQHSATVNDFKMELADRPPVIEIKPALLDYTWVVILDSWSQLADSTMRWGGEETGIDITEANTDKRAVYQVGQFKSNQFLSVIQASPCHFIVIGHTDEYTKMKKPDGVKIKDAKEKDMEVLFTKLIPKSTSRPHAMSMTAKFTDVAWMDADAMGNRRLDFRLSEDRVGGGHFEERKRATEYTFGKLVESIGGYVPDPDAPLADHPAVTYYDAGTFVLPKEKVAESIAAAALTNKPDAPKIQVIDKEEPKKPSGLAGLGGLNFAPRE